MFLDTIQQLVDLIDSSHLEILTKLCQTRIGSRTVADETAAENTMEVKKIFKKIS